MYFFLSLFCSTSMMIRSRSLGVCLLWSGCVSGRDKGQGCFFFLICFSVDLWKMMAIIFFFPSFFLSRYFRCRVRVLCEYWCVSYVSVFISVLPVAGVRSWRYYWSPNYLRLLLLLWLMMMLMLLSQLTALFMYRYWPDFLFLRLCIAFGNSAISLYAVC